MYAEMDEKRHSAICQHYQEKVQEYHLDPLHQEKERERQKERGSNCELTGYDVEA